MSEFAQSNPIVNSFWAETEDVSLLEAALLLLGIEPFDFVGDDPDPARTIAEIANFYRTQLFLHEQDVPPIRGGIPKDLLTRIEVLRSAIRTNKFNSAAVVKNERGEINETETRITMSEFLAWCGEKGIAVSIPGLQRSVPVPAPSSWPWGDHDTELLQKLDAAARKWWVNYDPADQTTAPTNETVSQWLKSQGVSDRVAEIMAQILRADGIPTGPRK